MDLFQSENLLGGLLCCLSTFPSLSNHFTSDAKFYLALLGQALAGLGISFTLPTPTKISQYWFNEEQRVIATTVMVMGMPLGLFIGQLLTPFIVLNETQIPIMNIVWFIPSAMGFFLTIWKVCMTKFVLCFYQQIKNSSLGEGKFTTNTSICICCTKF